MRLTHPVTRQLSGFDIDVVRRLYVVPTVPMSDRVVVCGVPEEETLQGHDATRNRSLAVILAVLLVAGFGGLSRQPRHPARAGFGGRENHAVELTRD